MKFASFLRLSFLCVLSTTVILAGCSGVGSTGGSGGGTQTTPPASTYVLTVTAPSSGAGTITSSPSGISCPGTCTASFATGTKVTLTETTGSNYFFGGWSGACTGSGSCSVTMSAAETVTPAFTPGEGVTIAITGAGAVSSSPAGITCPGTCSWNFPQNTAITLTASPTNDFTGWTGGGCSGTSTCNFTVTTAENVTAAFSIGEALTVALSGAGAGTVTSTPPGISCSASSPSTCTATFVQGTQVTLTETPITNDTFNGWSGACAGSAACSVTLSAASSVTATFTGSIKNNIDHIILFAQENRSLDHYFGAMLKYWQSIGLHQSDGVTFNGLAQFNGGATPSVPGCAAGTWGGDCDPVSSVPIKSFHLESACIENQSPFWNEAHNQWDIANPTGIGMNDSDPPLDGFAFTAAYDASSNGFMDVEGVRGMGYYDDGDLNYYYFMASNFATSDSWFAPTMSRTQLNRMYLIGATSHGQAYPIGGGCPPTECPGSLNNGVQLPSTTIFEELQNAGISWKIYVDPQATVSSSGQSCSSMTGTALSACLVENSYVNEFQYENTILGSPTLLAHIQPLSVYQSDAAAGTLPSFALIEPASDASLDEHPSDSDEYPVDVQAGQNYAATKVINPLMDSPNWSSSVLIFTYDEWGGLYDHVAPQPATAPGDGPYDSGDPTYPTDLFSSDICGKEPGQLGNGICNFSWTGYRVPLIIISPFAQKNFVSHNVRDTTAVLAMVEDRFGLSPLTNRDASYNSAQSVHATMAEFFNFTDPPWLTPPSPPTPDQNLVCNQVPPAGLYSPGGGWGEPTNLSVAVSINDAATITSNPSGINCDTDYTYGGSSTCGYVFPVGTSVTLTVTPNPGITFTDWSAELGKSGPCGLSTSPTCTITMDQDVYVQANLAQ
jgi:phospholipase C